MNASRTRHRYHIASRPPRLDPIRQSRYSLVLIALMSLATVSVMATTQALSAQKPGILQAESLR
jgi:hypothetical protein